MYLWAYQRPKHEHMRTLLVIVSLMLLGTVSAQELLGQEHWPDGTLKATRYSEGDRIHFITYHENGKVKEMGSLLQGKRDGEWKQYTESGALVARAAFNKGVRQAVWEFHKGTSGVFGRLTFNDGVLVFAEQSAEQGDIIAQRTYP